ncbi:MAG: hypothetical protein DRN06_06335 [Thermoprotei archaeon]|nr:MAG: hypothetical protein DRN06_06335 [Thermoprotei archaeon]
MYKYVVFRCLTCGHIQTTSSRFAKRRCPYCGKLNDLSKVQVLASASTAEEAAYQASRLKLEEAKKKPQQSASSSLSAE